MSQKENGGRIAQPSSWLNPPGRQIAAPTHLSNIIQQFKRAVSRAVGVSIWQKSYYDHIIRTPTDLEKTRQYIANNPLKRMKEHG